MSLHLIEDIKKSVAYLYREIISGRMPNFKNSRAMEKYIDNVINGSYNSGRDGELVIPNLTLPASRIEVELEDDDLINEIPSEHFETVKTFFYRVNQNERYGFDHPLAQTYAMDVKKSIPYPYDMDINYNDYFFWVKNPN